MSTGGQTIPVTDDARIIVDDDAMNAVVEWTDATNDTAALCSAVQTASETVGIQLGDAWSLAEIIARPETADGKFRATLVRGTGPTPPVHGRLEWAGNFFEKGFAVDPRTGQLDYRRRVQQCNVAENQVLCTIHPPQEGTPGHDVYGRPVAPEKPQRVAIRTGANVTCDEAQQVYSAACAGRLRLAGNVLAVDELLVVNGCIGLETGHVKHPGALQVEQDIEEGAEVEAAGDIEVFGVIEGAVVRAGGNILVHGGITGDRRCHITAGGSVRAKYICNADIEAIGNVEVEREIDQSQVRSRGAVLIPKGRVVGGSIIACAGVAVSQLGTDASVLTEVTTGVDYKLADEIDDVQHHAVELTLQLEKITTTVDAARAAEEKLTPQQRECVTLLMMRQSELVQEIEQCREQIALLESQSLARRKYCMVVQGRLCSDVVVDIAGCRTRTKQDHKGPLRVSLRDDEIDFVPIALRDSRGQVLKASA